MSPGLWDSTLTMASIKINLAVDRSRNRVLFADAGSDFVDVLLTFLTLPLSTIQSCSAGATSRGCLSNLCDSVNRLRDSRLLKVEACHGMLPRPAHADEFKVSKSANSCCNEVLIKGSKCCVLMARLLNVYNQAGNTETFVLFMLKASLYSDTVLTDAFLPNLPTDYHKAANASMEQVIINQKMLPSDQYSAGSSPESKIKIFYHTDEKKVMYAECNHESVGLLLGFLTYPISSVIKNTGVSTPHFGRCLNNLYKSVTDLDEAACLTGVPTRTKLLNPSLRPFDVLSNLVCRALDCQCRKDTMPELACFCCHPELVEDGRYVVGDDLLIHQASAMSLMKHWCGRNKGMVLEMDITIGKPEAVALLRAVLTSKTVLTDVFIDRLEDRF
ncbi:Polyubiquitin [Hordeum vulgare]|nr:Polyubiquitin [Hordeum vulgare]